MTWKELKQMVAGFLSPWRALDGDLHAIREAIEMLEWDAGTLLNRVRRLEAEDKRHLEEHRAAKEHQAKVAGSVEKTLSELERERTA